MMGRQDRDQRQLFYEFSLDEVVPRDHLLRRMNVFVTGVLADVHQHLKPFYSDIGRPSVDPELMIRMLIVGYCYGIRHERRLCEEVKLHLAYRWFCKSILRIGCRITPRFRSNVLSAFARATSCATFLSASSQPA
jgi:transposase